MYFSKSEDRRVKQVLSGNWYKWEQGKYKDIRKGCWTVNVVEMLCTHV
jgi:hypothetical protein